MPERTVPIIEGQIYHIYNRGNQKQQLFFDYSDWVRFLFLLLYSQSKIPIPRTSRHVGCFIRKGSFNVSAKVLERALSSRDVELLNFCIMPNHFHVTVMCKIEGGITRYLHRVSSAYAKYYNLKYEKTGHVFQGPFQAKLVDSDEYLHLLSAYIHLNIADVSRWKNNEVSYPWSSYQDYRQNRWGELLRPEVIMCNFTSFDDYRSFVETTRKDG